MFRLSPSLFFVAHTRLLSLHALSLPCPTLTLRKSFCSTKFTASLNMPLPTISTLELLMVRHITIMFHFPAHLPAALQGCFSSCTSSQSEYSCESPLLPDSFSGVLSFLFSSKGSLFHSRGHKFMFWSTTVIFILATAVIVVGPGLTLQAIPGVINFIDPSIPIGWSMHKIDVMTGVIAFVTRINVGFRFPVSSRAAITKASLFTSLSSATWSVHGELSFCGGMTVGWSSSSPPVLLGLSVRVHVSRTLEALY